MPIDWDRISATARNSKRHFEKLDVIPHYQGYALTWLDSSRLDRSGEAAGSLVRLVLAPDSGSAGDGRLLRVVHCTHDRSLPGRALNRTGVTTRQRRKLDESHITDSRMVLRMFARNCLLLIAQAIKTDRFDYLRADERRR